MLLHFAAFLACAWIAFRRNANGLFFHYDGALSLVEAKNQFLYSSGGLNLSNNFMAGLGNIQFGVNSRLVFYYWPISFIADFQLAKVASYLVMAACMFIAAYSLSFRISANRQASILTGWLLPVVTMPFVPRPFFYEILSVGPHFAMLILWPVAVFHVVQSFGRAGVKSDLTLFAILMTLIWYLIASNPMLAVFAAPGLVPYIAISLAASPSGRSMCIKLIALLAALVASVLLRWPEYLFGLFSYSAARVFTEEFIAVYTNATYVSILFQTEIFGWAGPSFVAGAAWGALLSLRDTRRILRAAAWTQLASLAVVLALFVVFATTDQWYGPPPVYLEICFYPLYAMFSAIAGVRIFHRAVRVVDADFLAASRPWAWHILIALMAPVALGGLALYLASSNPPTAADYNSSPPRETPIAGRLRKDIALTPTSTFRGRVATIVPVRPDGGDAWSEQLTLLKTRGDVSGNDNFSMSFWNLNIPTLFEYNQFTTPASHALIKRGLQEPYVRQQRNITVFTRANVGLLQLMGVRYVVLPDTAPAVGELRETETFDGKRLRLFELPAPNLATYSPVEVIRQSDLRSAISAVASESFDGAKTALVEDDIQGPLVPARNSTISMSGADLRVTAQSEGKSLIVLPLEFSRCIDMRAGGSFVGAGDASLHRVDGIFVGISFVRNLDVILAFRTGPFAKPLCRLNDYRDFVAKFKRD